MTGQQGAVMRTYYARQGEQPAGDADRLGGLACNDILWQGGGNFRCPA